jgi:hypothetical protein
MEEIIKILVSVLVEEIVKNIVKDNALKKRVAPDVPEFFLQFVPKKELPMTTNVTLNVPKINS